MKKLWVLLRLVIGPIARHRVRTLVTLLGIAISVCLVVWNLRGYQVLRRRIADTSRQEGRYDAVLSLYHDQGHIAAKTLDFHGTVSFTLGLPYLRTSVDHGTAFDIAGRGTASAHGMKAAILAACEFATPYRKWRRKHG